MIQKVLKFLIIIKHKGPLAQVLTVYKSRADREIYLLMTWETRGGGRGIEEKQDQKN